ELRQRSVSGRVTTLPRAIPRPVKILPQHQRQLEPRRLTDGLADALARAPKHAAFEPEGRLRRTVRGPTRREDIVPDVVQRRLPEDDEVGPVLFKILSEREQFLILPVPARADR